MIIPLSDQVKAQFGPPRRGINGGLKVTFAVGKDELEGALVYIAGHVSDKVFAEARLFTLAVIRVQPNSLGDRPRSYVLRKAGTTESPFSITHRVLGLIDILS